MLPQLRSAPELLSKSTIWQRLFLNVTFATYSRVICFQAETVCQILVLLWYNSHRAYVKFEQIVSKVC